MKEKITQEVVNKALEQANRGKAPNLYSWFQKNATKQAKEEFKRFKPQNNQDLLNIMMNNSTDKQVINPNTVYLKHNRKHIFVFINRQQDLYVVVDVDFTAESNLEKIKTVMEKYGYDTEISDDTVLFVKESNYFGIDVTLEFEKKDLEEEIKDLGNREGIMDNIVTFSENPQLRDDFWRLCVDLLEVKKDILLADHEINGNNHKFDIELINDVLNQDQQEIYDEYKDELDRAETLDEKIGVLCDYAEIDEDEFERLSDLEGVLEERTEEVINIAKSSIKFIDFTKWLEDLYTFVVLFDDIEHDVEDILNSEEYQEEYGD